MIDIQNINIVFDEPVILSGKLFISPGDMAVVKGKSGSGKSSLLYVAGLLMNDEKRLYNFNGHLLSSNDDELALYRKKRIGYVFQNNSLIDHLTIYENLQLYSQMAGYALSKSEAKDLLSMVHLKKDIMQETVTLSGGEKQRLAIACAISKQPDLLILDEPTSALDKNNAKIIMNILKESANKGMMILLASHDEFVISQCNVVYEIINHQLVRNQPAAGGAYQEGQEKGFHLNLTFYLDYYWKYLRAHLMIYSIMFVMCGLSVALLIGSSGITDAFEKKQQMNMDAIGNREIFVTSQKNQNDEAKYQHELEPFSEIQLAKIQNNSYCERLYPFYEADGFLVNEKNFHFGVQPYTQENNFENHCEKIGSDDQGIYLSSSLASKIGIDNIDGTSLSIAMDLPNGNQLEMDDMQIAGILKNNVTNWYTNTEDVLYIPIEKMPQLDVVKAVLVYAVHYDDTDFLREEIAAVNSEFGIFTRVSRTAYLKETMASIAALAPFLMSMVFLMTMTLVFLIYSRFMNQRKKEMCLLKVNGLSSKEIGVLIIIELLIQSAVITCCAMLLMVVVYFLIINVFQVGISFDYLKLCTASFVLSFVFMFIPSVISLVLFLKNDPAVILRTD